ncbi:hypothetical protein CDL60_09160 [Roseateles noduli]|nr:hypothetical protein CDL60_09160 [Roseateles noduli]
MDHPRRWIVAVALLLAAAAIAVQFWPESPKDGQVAMAATPAVAQPPAPVSTNASEPRVATAEKFEKTEKLAPSAVPAAPAASSVPINDTPVFKPPTTEDFGQIVLIGMHGGTPKQAGQAAYLLQTCLEFSLVDLSGAARKLSSQDPKRNSRIAAAEWFEDRCKSITPEMQAQRGALAARAVEAGGPEAAYVALVYGRSVGYRPPEAMRQPLLDAMNAAFRDGDRDIVKEFAFNGGRLGLSKAEARAYFLVSMSEAREAERPFHEAMLRDGPFRDMSEEEVRASETIAERLKQERKPPERRKG